MQVVKFEAKKHYPVIKEWWEKQNWHPLDLSVIPADGFIVEKDGEFLACVFVYRTLSKMFLMEWLVGNPDSKYEDRGEAQSLLLEYVALWCKKAGATRIFTMTKHERLLERLQDHDFIKTDENMTHLIRRI